MALTAFCLLLPEMNLSRSLRPTAGRREHASDTIQAVAGLLSHGRPPDPDLGAVDDPGLPAFAEVVDDLRQRP
jgi:hypothetical protein